MTYRISIDFKKENAFKFFDDHLSMFEQAVQQFDNKHLVYAEPTCIPTQLVLHDYLHGQSVQEHFVVRGMVEGNGRPVERDKYMKRRSTDQNPLNC